MEIQDETLANFKIRNFILSDKSSLQTFQIHDGTPAIFYLYVLADKSHPKFMEVQGGTHANFQIRNCALSDKSNLQTFQTHDGIPASFLLAGNTQNRQMPMPTTPSQVKSELKQASYTKTQLLQQRKIIVTYLYMI